LQGESTRILITGAGGFVGRHLIAHLLEAHAADPSLQIVATVASEIEARAAANSPSVTDAAGWTGCSVVGKIDVVALDICDRQAVLEQVKTRRPQQIYHLAARASGADADREAVFAVNVEGTRHLLEAAATLSDPPRVLLISTGYVYGDTDPERPACESDSVAPAGRYGPYTDSKLAMEELAGAYRSFVLITRAFSHTGPGQSPAFAIPAFARQLARIARGLEPPEIMVGNLEARRDLLDVRDVVRAYRLLMAHGALGETYNVATGQPYVLREVLNRLRAFLPFPTEVLLDPARLRPADIACSTGDPSRLFTAAGWKPHYSLEDTLRATLTWAEQKERGKV